jgi:hypothetical protein
MADPEAGKQGLRVSPSTLKSAGALAQRRLKAGARAVSGAPDSDERKARGGAAQAQCNERVISP